MDNLSPHEGLPVFTGPTEMLGATIHLSMMGGAVAALPVLTLSVYQLLSSLLTRQQRRFVILFLPAIFLFYVGGGAFAYFVMLPTGLTFLLHFGEGVAVPLIRITEYMSLVTAMIFWLGVVFELPLAMFLLAKLRLVSHARFRKFRKFVPAAAFVLSAIITPTFDVVNQTLVAVPIIVLFEVGLFLAWLARPKKEGQRTMGQVIKALVIGILRRLAVVLAIAPAVVVGAVYVAAQPVVFVWDGHLSTETESRARAWLDSVYWKMLRGIARVTFL